METPITIAETDFFLDSKHPIHQSIDQVRDDVGGLKNILEQLLAEDLPDTEQGIVDESRGEATTLTIELEWPSKALWKLNNDFLELAASDSLFEALSQIWRLTSGTDGGPPPFAYTYLWDWVIVRKRDHRPLLVRGVINKLRVGSIFDQGDVWQGVSSRWAASAPPGAIPNREG